MPSTLFSISDVTGSKYICSQVNQQPEYRNDNIIDSTNLVGNLNSDLSLVGASHEHNQIGNICSAGSVYPAFNKRITKMETKWDPFL